MKSKPGDGNIDTSTGPNQMSPQQCSKMSLPVVARRSKD